MENITLKLLEEKLASLPKDYNELVIKTFKDVERLEKEVKTLTEERDSVEREYSDEKEYARKLRQEIASLQELKLKKEDLDERERNLAIVQLKHELEVSNKSKLDIYNLVNMLMKNPRAIEIISTTSTIPVYEGQMGGGGYHSQQPGSEFSTVEKKETKSDDNYID